MAITTNSGGKTELPASFSLVPMVTDMLKNQVTIKGVIEPKALCNKIMKKTKRRTNVLFPLPAAEDEAVPQVVASQVSGQTTVACGLNVNMHCEACGQQLKRKILKMKGVRTVETELSSSKVTVTGTLAANKLVEYVYRRTKKTAKIVPQPEPEPEKPKEEAWPGESKEEKPAEEPKPDQEKKEGAGRDKHPEEEKREEGGGGGGDTLPEGKG